MEYREVNYQNDVNEIVALIKDNLQPKYSKEIFNWKHLHNPFGPSFSMVAVENNKIAGVVFYMRYNFRNSNGDIIKCVRPFDACTDKKHRGKGIFKKLMVDILSKYNQDYDFLLANPNPSSYPEFIKLGWIEPQQSFYRFGFISPVIGSKNKMEVIYLPYDSTLPSGENYFISGNTLDFLNWRFQEEKYKVVKVYCENWLSVVVYRIERKFKLKFIVLCEFYGEIKNINMALREVCRKESIYLVYYIENQITSNLKFIVSKSHKKAVKVFKTNNFSIPENLVVSLGDMEGRL